MPQRALLELVLLLCYASAMQSLQRVDVYATRPEALLFPRRNISRPYRHQAVWGYFFATRPDDAAAGGSSRNFRNVWRALVLVLVLCRPGPEIEAGVNL
jgi:hypothetical protein